MHPSLSLSKSYLVQIQRVVLVDGFDAKIHSFVTYLPSTLIMVLEFMFDPHLAFTPRGPNSTKYNSASVWLLNRRNGGRNGPMAQFRLNCCSFAGRYDFCHEGARESGSVVRGRARNEEEGLAWMGLLDR